MSATILSRSAATSALPVKNMEVNGVEHRVLVDTGCTKTVAHASVCSSWTKQNTYITTVNGSEMRCVGVGTVKLRLLSGAEACVEVLVVRDRPLNFSLILGMNGVEAFHGVTVRGPSEVEFGVENSLALAACVAEKPSEVEFNVDNSLAPAACVAEKSETVIDEMDFSVQYDRESKKWTVEWKWRGGNEPESLKNTTTEYHVKPEVREQYEMELREWIAEGWLVPYSLEEHGPVKGTIPLMAVTQKNKEGKVRPVMDFRELNERLSPHTADADVCGEKVREWRRRGRDIAMIDLRKAYLQINVAQSLWAYQTVVFGGQRYVLRVLGFGLSIAPIVMKKILGFVLAQDERIARATSHYVDDICLDETEVSAGELESHLLNHGLVCKPAERVIDGARVLGIRVWGEQDGLFWKRDNQLPQIPSTLTRRAVFSICGQLTSHMPVCGWLRVATSYIKRRANAATESWDDPVKEEGVLTMLQETIQRVQATDPACGKWNIEGERATVWVDASSLAIAAVMEVDGHTVEDVTSLRQNECAHINLAELDAALRGVNLAIQWGMKIVTLCTDSMTVYHWLTDALTGKSRLRTTAASEMLLRRRLATITEVVKEYELQLDVRYVRSEENKADALTRVPKRWMLSAGKQDICGVAAAVLSKDEMRRIHETSGHPGIKRTLYFCRRVHPSVTRRQVRAVVNECNDCRSVDPAPVRWEKGELSVAGCWERLAIDICHVGSAHYLSVIDCGPSRFAMWRKLRRQDSSAVTEQLELIFCERGPPMEILLDNAACFRGALFRQFCDRWDVRLRFRCANAAFGNSIVERNHRSVKRIVARTSCSVPEAVYRYNVMPRDTHSASAPANRLYSYEVRVKDIDPVSVDSEPFSGEGRDTGGQAIKFKVGDRVWVRDPSRRCDVRSRVGTVTKLTSPQNVEVDDMPCHVRDLRHVTGLQAEVPAEGLRGGQGDDSDDDSENRQLLVCRTHSEDVCDERGGMEESDKITERDAAVEEFEEVIGNVGGDDEVAEAVGDISDAEEFADAVDNEISFPRRSSRTRRIFVPFQYDN